MTDKKAIIAELQEFLEEEEWQEWKEVDGIEILPESVHYAIKFLEGTDFFDDKLHEHVVGLFNDGEVAYTWRKDDVGIINLAFNKEGIVTWAAYIQVGGDKTYKGRFNVGDPIPQIESLVNIIIKRQRDD